MLGQYTKAIVNVLTLVVSIGTLILHYTNGFLPGPIGVWVGIIVGAAGAILHVLAPNETTNPAVAANRSVRLKKRVTPVKKAA